MNYYKIYLECKSGTARPRLKGRRRARLFIGK
nr:MAG TPA: hypothetical protein [Caudoviricetes sp.]